MSEKFMTDFPAFAERGEGGQYSITFREKADYKIYRGSSETEINKEDVMESGGETVFPEVQFPQERAVFAVEESGKKPFYVSEKLIPMQGTPNFRDLGGIVNRQGRQVKWGKFFRSGALAKLTDTDLEYFKTLNIRTVIDFRTKEEMDYEADRFPADYKLDYVVATIGNPADFRELMKKYDFAKITPEQIVMLMIKGAEKFVKDIKDFTPVFDALKQDEPFLFHCSAGKDRTGLAAMLILSTLDVSRENIFEDYLLSNKYTVPYFTKSKEMIASLGLSEETARAAAGVREEYMATTFSAIETKYGSFDNMINEVFGITPEIKNELIEKYTV